MLLQFKGNRDTKGYPNGPAPLLSRSHLWKFFNDPFCLCLQVFVRATQSNISYTSILLDGKHYTYPSLHPHFLCNFGVLEILTDVFLHHFVKTFPFILGIFTAGKYGNILDYGKGNINIHWFLLYLYVLHFGNFLFLATFGGFYHGFNDLFLILHYLDHLRGGRGRWGRWGFDLFGHRHLLYQLIFHV